VDLVPPTATAIQRSTDRQDPDTWLIRTREGPVYGRFYRDGRRIFFMMPRVATDAETAWRPWTEADRPTVDNVWQSFRTWWTDQGHEWPPE
jgi:hypothetical protein